MSNENIKTILDDFSDQQTFPVLKEGEDLHVALAHYQSTFSDLIADDIQHFLFNELVESSIGASLDVQSDNIASYLRKSFGTFHMSDKHLVNLLKPILNNQSLMKSCNDIFDLTKMNSNPALGAESRNANLEEIENIKLKIIKISEASKHTICDEITKRLPMSKQTFKISNFASLPMSKQTFKISNFASLSEENDSEDSSFSEDHKHDEEDDNVDNDEEDDDDNDEHDGYDHDEEDDLFFEMKKFYFSWKKWCLSTKKEKLHHSVKVKIERSVSLCRGYRRVSLNPETKFHCKNSFGNLINKLNEVDVSLETMETVYNHVGNVLQFISNRQDIEDYESFIEIFAHVRYVCACFTTMSNCDLHTCVETDGNENTQFLRFLKDYSEWLNTIHTDRVSKEHRFNFEKSLPEFFQDPKQYFDADIYNRHIKDRLILKDAFRLENKIQLGTQIHSIVKNMCRETCKCDSIKTLPFLLLFANMRQMLRHTK